MANTYVKIAEVSVGAGGASSIDFSSIPSTYTDLCLKMSIRGNQSAVDDYINLRFNNDSGANYSMRAVFINATSSAAASSSWTSQTNAYIYQITAANATASTFGNVELYIPNYAGSTAKSWSNDGAPETNSATWTTRGAVLNAGIWTGTAAINQITLSVGGSTLFAQYSTAYLYGILKS